ncbi:hypothetical protein [Rhizobium sp. Root651]|uniref:hypothetical protein n=1 Tax=Rhizobium sp. Root651 TaxID=1736577 RepID=UPI000715E536|nr:hypothetical protein [Rhizobium sp. Root651]KRA59034.1 hypothetical protein ASD85_15210 [Rhizobium sp. Root651]
MAGYLFGGNTGVSYNDLQRRREIADALSKQIMGETPKTTAQGIGALMKGIGAGIGRYSANKGLKEGTDGANSAYESILGRIMGGSPSAGSSVASSAGGGGAIPMPGAASEIAATSPNGGGMQNYRDAIASIESKGSGDYSAVGPTHPKMGRALGRYQIMEANIGPWSQAALGRAVTPEEFMANPQLQDAVFDHQFGQYVQKYGPEGAAQAWLGGPGGVGKTDRKDSLGTSIGEYGKRFMAAGGGAQVASLDPSAGMSAADAIETAAPRAPAPGGYRDPMVSAPNAYRGSDYNSPMVTYDDRGMRVERPSQQLQPPAQQQAPMQVAQNGQYPTAPQPPAPPMPPQPSANPYNGVDPEMLKLLSNPFLDPDKKQIIQGIVQQQMERNDPLKQMQLQKGQMELDALRNPRPEYNYTTLPDGTVLRTDKRGGAPEKVYESDQKPTTNQQDYEYYRDFETKNGRQPLGPLEWEQSQRKAGASNTTNVVGGEGDKFYQKLDEKNAETFAAMSDAGAQSRAKMGQIDRLENLFANVPQGIEGGLKKIAGDWGVAIGEGTSDIQAATALLEKMVPEQRAPGTGPMSDADIKMFRASLPRVLNQPGGNQLIFQTMRGIAEYEMQMGEIADQVADRTIKPSEGRKLIRELKNPLDGYKIPEGSTPNGGFKTTTGVQWSIGD